MNMTVEEIEQLLALKKSGLFEFNDLTSKKTPRPSQENAEQLFAFYNIRIRHNEMTKSTEIDIPSEYFHSDTEMNAKLAYIRNLYVKHDISDKNLDGYITAIANANSYHPVRDWIDSHTWDGVSRLELFYNSLETDPDLHIDAVEYEQLKETMMRKWALSAVAALYHPGFSCEGVLCLYGDQAAGKTTWFQSLLPAEYQNEWFKDAVALDVSNKDSLMKALGTWVTELGEIDATFKKSDIEALKGFITEKIDTIRPPYERVANKYSRRTVFVGTMNRQQFLQDDENRRFWPINVRRVHYADFDVGQFWAEIKQMYLRIQPLSATPRLRIENNEFGWFLTPAERLALTRVQTVFKSDDPVEELLANRVAGLQSMPGQETWQNTTAILTACGKAYPTKAELNTAAKWLRQQRYPYMKMTKQFKVWVPPVVNGASITNSFEETAETIEILRGKMNNLFKRQ